jgi:hypothetical protein
MLLPVNFQKQSFFFHTHNALRNGLYPLEANIREAQYPADFTTLGYFGHNTFAHNMLPLAPWAM